MTWKRYQNELIVLGAFVIMGVGYLYKQGQQRTQIHLIQEATKTYDELKEVIALKKVWTDKRMTQKLSRLKTLVPAEKLQWSQKGKKLTASYKGLDDKELNTVVTKLLNLPVEMKTFKVKQASGVYHVELKCQW